jgi:hypothetical protein
LTNSANPTGSTSHSWQRKARNCRCPTYVAQSHSRHIQLHIASTSVYIHHNSSAFRARVVFAESLALRSGTKQKAIYHTPSSNTPARVLPPCWPVPICARSRESRYWIRCHGSPNTSCDRRTIGYLHHQLRDSARGHLSCWGFGDFVFRWPRVPP